MKIMNIQTIVAVSALFMAMSADGHQKDTQSIDINSSIGKADSIVCRVSGTITDRPQTTSVFIIEAEKDFRIHSGYTVPVIDGKFNLTLMDRQPLAYEVIFYDELEKGSWQNRIFFSGDGDVELVYNNSNEPGKDKVISQLQDNILAEKFSEMDKERFNAKRELLYANLHSLHENGKAYTPEFQNLLDQLDTTPKVESRDSIRELVSRMNKGPKERRYTKEYLAYHTELNRLYSQADSLKRSFISQNPSIYGLYSIKYAFLLAGSRHDWIDLPAYIDIFERYYKEQMSDHPYTEEIQGLIDARQMKVGNRYPDYKVTREDGSTERIASLIKGNTAVIDLWASWCGPCRKHSKELIPLYEKYKDKGFKVIAVARESDDCTAMNEAMKKDGYPWESFVDINDRDNVWRINQAGNGGGKIILVDSDGTIIGTDIPTEEIKEFLINTYGE